MSEKSRQSVPDWEPKGDGDLAPAAPLREYFSEYLAYTECKRLLNQIVVNQQKQGFKTVAVLSNMAREGKSFFVLSLALGYATLLGKRVLVVDVVNQTSDRSLFRETILGEERTEQGVACGLVELLSTRNKDGRSAEATDFQIGPYVDSIKDLFDLVLYDTCALDSATKENIDPVIIARSADVSILVTSPRSIGGDLISRTKERLERWDIKLLGMVFNDGIQEQG
jgi:Mrp family chromosome partitioning ATPase